MATEITYGSKDESEYIRRRLIEYNHEHVPDDLKNIYEEINLTIKNDEGKIIGGILSVHCWNWIEVDILWIDKAFKLRILQKRKNAHSSNSILLIFKLQNSIKKMDIKKLQFLKTLH